MARVGMGRYVAQRSLNPGSAPQARLDDSVGQALKGLGSAVSGIVAANAERTQQRDNFKANNDYNVFKQNVDAELAERLIQQDGDGEGFHDRFLSDVYKPRRDAFLDTLNPELRERYETLLSDDDAAPGQDYVNASVRAAVGEREVRHTWYRDQLDVSQKQLASAIDLDPDGFDDYRASGAALIESAGLPTAEKRERLQQWDNFASTSYLNKLLDERPEDVLRAMNVDPRQLNPSTKAALLEQAVIGVESSGNPNAVSPKGATGLMQVMPATAAEIAGELKDNLFPYGDPAAIDAYLKDPAVSRKYGMHYLNKQLKAFGGDLEAALVAYNGGPERAKAWIAAGRDDSVIPKESADYYKKVIRRMSALPSKDVTGADVYPDAERSDVPEVPVQAASAYLKRVLTAGKEDSHVEGMGDVLKSRLAALLQAAPPEIRQGLGVFSGYRSAEHQARIIANNAGKYGFSRADWEADVKALGPEEAGKKWRPQLRALGVTKFIAMPGSSNHQKGAAADLSYNGNSLSQAPDNVVKWLHDNAGRYGLTFPMEHENWHIEVAGARSGAAPTRTRLDSLTVDQRSKFIAQAQQRVSDRYDRETVSPVERVEVRRAMSNELALYRATGGGSEAFNETDIVRTLGEDDYNKWSYQRDQAQRIYGATTGIATMAPSEMEARLRSYSAQAGSSSFASDLEVREAVVNEIDRVQRLRAKDPGAAALEYDDLRGEREALEAKMTGSKDGVGAVPPEEVRAFVSKMIDRQTSFNISKKAIAPVPREWALQIGQSLASIPELGAGDLSATRAGIAVQYKNFEQYFGEYTDDVILYALSEYHGLDEGTADMVTSMMTAIALGKDPFKQRQAPAVEEEKMGWLEWAGDKMGFGDDDDAIDPELLRRTIEEIRNAETDADREAIRARRGAAVYDAANLQAGQ